MSYPAPAQPSPSWVAAPPPLRSSRLGRIAMLLAIATITLSLAASVLIALFATNVIDQGPMGGVGFTTSSNPLAAGAHILLGTAAGVTALVLGIIAIAQKRGRAQGIVAVVIAGVAPGLSLIVYTVVATTTHR